MSDKRKRESMDNLDRSYKVVQQNSRGISAVDIAKKLGVHRTTAHGYLNTLELTGKVYSEHGQWYPRESEKQGKPVVPRFLIERFWREEEEIEKENVYGNAFVAYQKATLLKAKLPEKFKQKLDPAFVEVEMNLAHRNYTELGTMIKRTNYLKHVGIPLIVEAVSNLLYEMEKEGVKP